MSPIEVLAVLVFVGLIVGPFLVRRWLDRRAKTVDYERECRDPPTMGDTWGVGGGGT